MPTATTTTTMAARTSNRPPPRVVHLPPRTRIAPVGPMPRSAARSTAVAAAEDRRPQAPGLVYRSATSPAELPPRLRPRTCIRL